MKKTYKYFISCNIQSNTINGMANYEVIRNKAIKGIADIIETSHLIEKENNYPQNSVAILFYKEF